MGSPLIAPLLVGALIAYLRRACLFAATSVFQLERIHVGVALQKQANSINGILLCHRRATRSLFVALFISSPAAIA